LTAAPVSIPSTDDRTETPAQPRVARGASGRMGHLPAPARHPCRRGRPWPRSPLL